MKKRICFIVNPFAGGGKCKRRFMKLRKMLPDCGIDYKIYWTKSCGDATKFVSMMISKRMFDCIAAVGGDGTIHEVVQALAFSEIPLCIIPFGSGNDFAKSVGVTGSYRKILRSLQEFCVRRIDIGTANDVPFVNVSGMGLDVSVLKNIVQSKKNMSGMTVHIYGIFRALHNMRNYEVSIKCDDYKFEGKIALLAICNGSYYAGGMKVAPLADMTDGYLDVCILCNMDKWGILRILPEFVRGSHVNSKNVKYFKTKEILIMSKEDCEIELDGEIQQKTPVLYKIYNKSLSVIV